MEVGQEVLVKGLNNQYGAQIVKDKIKSIGRKYFKLESNRCRFIIESLVDDPGQYSSSYRVYFSEQEIEDEKRVCFLNRKIRNSFQYSNSRLTLEQLEQINNIIEKTLVVK